ncbi:hypothetical protein NQ315_010006 [Exocentrus adspersus]|uniref:Uncharacterized protein n=1 Tax=Exocentrus adspersus TaxID=1586481 RepID=A0AAV8VKQ5_9CUCU|nr:hypothetical protein NQ315_010006 [Exocentrus adspersus]
MKFLIVCCVLFILVGLALDVDCKRGGRSRSRGSGKHTSGGDCGWLCNKNSKKTAPSPKQAVPPPPKPSAPRQEPTIKKETANTQQSSNAQRPIGWNVPGTNQNPSPSNQNSGWKSGYQTQGL